MSSRCVTSANQPENLEISQQKNIKICSTNLVTWGYELNIGHYGSLIYPVVNACLVHNWNSKLTYLNSAVFTYGYILTN